MLTLGFTNVDRAIVQHNVLRSTQSWHFNAHHLASLSPDVIPEKVVAYHNEQLPEQHRVALGAQLLCLEYFRSEWVGADWRSYSLSQDLARRALDDVLPELGHYRLNDYLWPPRVRTAQGEIYECPARARW